MTKDEFEKLYRSHQLFELEEILHVSRPLIYKRIRELGIPLKGRGNGGKKKKLIIEEG